MGSSDLKSFYFRKKMMEKGLIGNSLTTELLTLPWLEASKKRLQDDPLILKSLIDQGILRDTIKSMNIGLATDGRLYMPLYNSKLEVGGIFYFSSDFEIGSYEFTSGTPNYVLGNPCVSYKESQEVLVCESIKEVLFAFQLWFDNPIMIADQEHFPHNLFTQFKKISLLHSTDNLFDLIGREFICCYHLEHELAPEDTMEHLIENKRWWHYGTLSYTHRTNPFVYMDKLWWLIQSPVTKRKYLVESWWATYDVTYKNVWKTLPLHVATTEYWEVRMTCDSLFMTIGDQIQSAPSTEQVFETLCESMKYALPFMKEIYIEAVAWWVMYSYISVHAPLGPKNIMVHFENNSHKASFEYYMNTFFMPWDRGNMPTYSMASTLLLKVDRANLPQEGSYAPKLMIASIKDYWLDFPPALFICQATGQDEELRNTEFKMLKGIRSLLFRWSLGYKPIPHSEIIIPPGMGPYAFLYLVCPTKTCMQNLINDCFNESLMYRATMEKDMRIIPKKLAKKNTRYAKATLANDIIFRWKKPPVNPKSKSESLNSSEEKESSVNE